MTEVVNETVWRRALRDSESFRHSGRFFWGCEVLGAAAFAAIVAYFFLPDDPSRFESAIYPLSGVVLGFVAAYALIYLWNFIRAPYRQRNEVREFAATVQRQRESLEAVNQKDVLIQATPSQASSLRPTGRGGDTVSEIVAYLDVATTDTNKPLRNCRIKLLDLYHHMAYMDRNKGQVVERWDRDSFYAGQTYFFSWSGRDNSVDAVDVHSQERATIARCLGTTLTELTTTSGRVGHIFHGDQYHLTVEITADNSRPVTKEYWLRMHQGKSAVIEEWDDSRTSWL